MKSFVRQKGVALITVLLVFTLVVFIASAIFNQQYALMRSTAQKVNDAQTWQYALAGEAYARQILFQDFKVDAETKKMADHPAENWYLTAKSFEFSSGVLEVTIRDLQGRYNLNNLASFAEDSSKNGQDTAPEEKQETEGQETQEILLEPEKPSDTESTENSDKASDSGWFKLLNSMKLNKDYALALEDWLDIDEVPQGIDTEDQGYLKNEPGYRVANGPVSSITELHLLQGMKKKDIECLSPHITSLPAQTQINLNTASAMALTTVSDNITPEIAEEIVKARSDQGFESVDEFLQDESIAGIQLTETNLTVRSDYFQIYVRAEYGDRVIYLDSWLHRDPDNGAIKLLRRTQIAGSDYALVAGDHHDNEDIAQQECL